MASFYNMIKKGCILNKQPRHLSIPQRHPETILASLKEPAWPEVLVYRIISSSVIALLCWRQKTHELPKPQCLWNSIAIREPTLNRCIGALLRLRCGGKRSLKIAEPHGLSISVSEVICEMRSTNAIIKEDQSQRVARWMGWRHLETTVLLMCLHPRSLLQTLLFVLWFCQVYIYLLRDNGCSSIVLTPLCLKGSVVTTETCVEEISKLFLRS